MAETSRRSRLARRLGAYAVIVLAIAVVAVVLLVTERPQPPAGATVSTSPAAWVLPRLGGGGDVRLDQFRGRPVVVTFFASWCTACQDELPLMESAARQLRGRVAFAGVDSEETGDGAAMARRFGITWWPLALDVDGAADSGLHDALGGTGMPITAFYDASGHLLFVAPAAVSADTLSADLHRYYGVTVTL